MKNKKEQKNDYNISLTFTPRAVLEKALFNRHVIKIYILINSGDPILVKKIYYKGKYNINSNLKPVVKHESGALKIKMEDFS